MAKRLSFYPAAGKRQSRPSRSIPPCPSSTGGCSLQGPSQQPGRGVKSSPWGVCSNRFPWNCVVKYPKMLHEGGKLFGGARWKHPAGCTQSRSCQMGKAGQEIKNRMRIPWSSDICRDYQWKWRRMSCTGGR